MKKKALTAGELLITITIIGVIAVLVIPGLLNSYHNNLYSTKIKNIYGTIMTSIERSCTDKNVSYFYQVTNQESELKKYLQVKNVPTTDTVSKYFASDYQAIGTASSTDPVSLYDKFFVLKSGEAVSISCDRDESKCSFIVDINSTEEPNIGGRDIFSFSIDTTTNSLLTADKSTCTTSKSGVGCLEYLIDNNWKMNY